MTQSLSEVEAVVRPHLKLLSPEDTLTPEQSLGEAGLDSMASIDLLLDLEERFGVTIDDDNLTENSFATLAEIQNLIELSR
ncbi:MAG: phosphopantetheine-binding protein [Verrucomicrobiales bacterium]|nr:phosphopantetheine-binding protein [Verrucomicrobiales bacterium]